MVKFYTKLKTPLCEIILAGGSAGLSHIFFNKDGKIKLPAEWVKDDDFFTDTVKQIEEYFRGKRTQFKVKLDLHGTDFQKKVWNALLRIPYGETRSYGSIARAINKPKACRAVGMANSKNPIPLIVPCHRVIGADGSLTGFAGGLTIKEKLLKLEKNIPSV
jgi:methylated-DNA-[protein]-cysteine S-methyltransferase